MKNTIEWLYGGPTVGPRRPCLSWFTRFPPYYCPEVMAVVLGSYDDEDAEMRVVLLHRPESVHWNYLVKNDTLYIFEDQCINDLEIQPAAKAASKTSTTPNKMTDLQERVHRKFSALVEA